MDTGEPRATWCCATPKMASVRAQSPLEPGETLAVWLLTKISSITSRAKVGENKSFLTAILPSGVRGRGDCRVRFDGSPATWGGMLAVPYRYQMVHPRRAETVRELTRIRQKDEQIGFIRPGKNGFLYGVGASRAALLDEQSGSGEKKTISYLDAAAREQVRVFLHWDGYRPEQTDFRRSIATDFCGTPSSRAMRCTLPTTRPVLHSYRFLFGMNAKDGTVRWAYMQIRRRP